CAIAWAARRSAESLRVPALAEWLEHSGAWRLGSLRALLERSQRGSSEELAAAADASSAAAVSARAHDALLPLGAQQSGHQRVALALLGAGALALGTNSQLRGAGSMLWHPLRAWHAAVSPLQLRASSDSVDRGKPVTFTVTTYGRNQATLWL